MKSPLAVHSRPVAPLPASEGQGGQQRTAAVGKPGNPEHTTLWPLPAGGRCNCAPSPSMHAGWSKGAQAGASAIPVPGAHALAAPQAQGKGQRWFGRQEHRPQRGQAARPLCSTAQRGLSRASKTHRQPRPAGPPRCGRNPARSGRSGSLGRAERPARRRPAPAAGCPGHTGPACAQHSTAQHSTTGHAQQLSVQAGMREQLLQTRRQGGRQPPLELAAISASRESWGGAIWSAKHPASSTSPAAAAAVV